MGGPGGVPVTQDGPKLVWKAFHGAGGRFEIEMGDSFLQAAVLPSAEFAQDLMERSRPRLARCVGTEGLTGVIEGLWVQHPQRSKGLGSKMVRMALEKFIELGARAAVLRAIPAKPEDLAALLRFYKRFGFSAEAPCQDAGEPYLAMGLLLPDAKL